jgi:hypothetical protein
MRLGTNSKMQSRLPTSKQWDHYSNEIDIKVKYRYERLPELAEVFL